MRRGFRLAIVLGMIVLPLLFFYWRGYIELYRRDDSADVRVNGVPAGYVHRGRVSAIVTRTDVPVAHSYRIWTTATEILIFDCHNWVAPDRSFFFQGKVASPCIFPTSAVVSHAPTAPATNGMDDNGTLRFTTRDGKVVSLKRPW